MRFVVVVIELRDISCNYIVKFWKIVEFKKGFYFLSKIFFSNRLRDIIGFDVVKKNICIVIDIVYVVNEIYVCGIVYKNINGFFVFVDINGNVGLLCFIGFKIMSIEYSDNLYE